MVNVRFPISFGRVDTDIFGIVYVPLLNWLLLLGTILAAAIYNNVRVETCLLEVYNAKSVLDYITWECLWSLCGK
jgi:hypothetical protein